MKDEQESTQTESNDDTKAASLEDQTEEADEDGLIETNKIRLKVDFT